MKNQVTAKVTAIGVNDQETRASLVVLMKDFESRNPMATKSEPLTMYTNEPAGLRYVQNYDLV